MFGLSRVVVEGNSMACL